MRVLGVDPGIGRLGWAVVEGSRHKMRLVASGCIETQASTPMNERLFTIHNDLSYIFTEYKPQTVAVEELFFNTNAKTAFAVGQARGIVLLLTAVHKVSSTSYTPLQVKIAVAGYGRAEKHQIGHMIKVLLKMQALPKRDDTIDAIAIALTHIFSTRKK